MKRLLYVLAFFALGNLAVAQTPCADTTELVDYINRGSGFTVYGISGSGGNVVGTNDITFEVGNNYDFGQGIVTGVYIWFGSVDIVGQPDTIRVSVYSTRGTDSLPGPGNPAPLGFTTMTTDQIDTVDGTFQDDAVFIEFPGGVQVNGRFAVTVQVAGAGLNDTIGIVSSVQGDGLGERRAIGKFTGNTWLHLSQVWTLSANEPLDVDVIMLPEVVLIPSAVASISPSNQQNTCPGSTINLNGQVYLCSDNYTVEWTGPGVNNPFNPFSTATIPAGTASGVVSYSFTAIDVTNGDTVTSNVVTINVRAIEVDLGADVQVACGTKATLTASVTGTTSLANFAWSNGASGINNTNLNPGNYCVTATNSFGCTDSDCAIVSNTGINQTLSFNVNAANPSNTNVCVNDAVTFTNTSTDLGASWNWRWTFGYDSTIVSSSQSPTYPYPATGGYTATLEAFTLVGSDTCWAAPVSRTITVQVCNGIEESIFLTNNISIFPNPASESLVMQFSKLDNKKGTVSFFDIAGALVSAEEITINGEGQKNFDVANFAPGLYLVKVQLGDEYAMKKLTIGR